MAITRLTNRPYNGANGYEGYERWRNRWQTVINERNDFKTGGSLAGASAGWYGSGGQLPAEWVEALSNYRADVSYVIWSYYTPIALWVQQGDSGFWVIPPVTYSRTTSRQQSLISSLISQSGERVVTSLADLTV